MTESQLTYRKSHALLIGIDDYQHFPPLGTAVKGVRALARVLQEHLGFQPENIITLENEQATQRAIQRSLLDPLSREEKVGRDDRVLIYFAGHGTTVDTVAGAVGYLIPVDADPDYEDTFIAMDDLTRMAAERIYARHVLFLLDACFSGFATTRMAEGVKRELGDLLRSPSRQVITAGMRDQVVSDTWGPEGHSLFTGFLIEGLRGAAPMPGGILRTFHLAGYLQDQVAQHSRSRQTPEYASLIGSQGGDFVFAVREVSALPDWVLSAIESPDTSQRLIAANKLREIASDTAHSQMAGQALAKLEELSEDQDVVVRASVGAALRELMPQAGPILQEREDPLVVQSASPMSETPSGSAAKSNVSTNESATSQLARPKRIPSWGWVVLMLLLAVVGVSVFLMRGGAVQTPQDAPGKSTIQPQGQPTATSARLSNVGLGKLPPEGPPDALVKIVEFGDFQSPSSKTWNDNTLTPLRQKYGNKIAIYFRHYPMTELHPEALNGALAAECANAQGKFWTMHDALFQTQSAISVNNSESLAESIGLDAPKFNYCMSANLYQANIAADISDGDAYGVTAAPTFFVNGVRLVGAMPLESFTSVIDQELYGK